MLRVLGPLGAAVLVLAAAGGARAAPAAPSPTAPPADAADPGFAADPDDAAVEAWATTRLQMPDWRYVGHTTGAAMFVPSAVAPSDGHVVAPVRVEMFRPEKTPDGLVYRSMQVTMELDCARRAYAPRAYAIYAGHDLKEQLDKADAPADVGWKPVEPDDVVNVELLKACAPPEGPKSAAEADVLPWLARTVQPGGDAFAYYDAEGAWYVHGPMTRAPSGEVGFTGRVELFEPEAGMRSSTMRIELDCKGRRVRLSDARDYPGHNLKGEGAPLKSPADWSAPSTGEQSLQMDRLCAMAAAAPGR
jgi:hypothetical protein